MRVFLTGASGYIGGAVAMRLIKDGATVHGLVRTADKAEAVAALGMVPVLGTLEDAELLRAEAIAADATINTASSDHREAVETLVGALANSGKPLLHTSGIGVVCDSAGGEPTSHINDEEDELVPSPFRLDRAAIDRLVLDAPGVRSMVLCNTIIYGNPLGVQGESVLFAELARPALVSGQARYIGRGLNRWANCEVSDAAELYALALLKAPASSFLYVENGEEEFRTLANAIAERLGLGEATGATEQEAKAIWGSASHPLGANSRVRGRLGRRLGWQPKHNSIVDWVKSPSSQLCAPNGVVRQIAGYATS
jgi:nucleoside-diphosphate-sugar epimerase